MSSSSAQAASFSDGQGRWLNFEVRRTDHEATLVIKQGDGRVLLELNDEPSLRYLADVLQTGAAD